MFGTSSNNLKLGDAVVKINGVIPERSKMDEEKLTPPASNSQGNAMNFYDYENVITLLEGDIRNIEDCQKATEGVDYVLHQAALGSVPRSLKDPITSNEVNVSGFLNMLVAARDAKVKRFIYAASSSTYGDSQGLPKVEDVIGKPLSPYAITKYVNELYADIFSKTYGLETIGLRYFNVFGRRQDPNGAYAAVIPLFIKSAMKNIQPKINGDGSITRDFTPVRNVIQINSKALLNIHDEPFHHVLNVACGQSLKLIELWDLIKKITGTEIEPIDGFTENFSSMIYNYYGYQFAITHGQGSVLSIYKDKELIYRT